MKRPIIKSFRQIFFLTLVFTGISCFSIEGDTTISTYWKNGNLKTATVYKIKHQKDKENNSITILKKKNTTYYDFPDGEEVSKQSFDFDYDFNNRFDSLLERKHSSNQNGQIKRGIRLYLGIGSNGPIIPFTLSNGKDKTKNYKEKDTLINKIKYSVQIFSRDSILSTSKDSLKNNFIGTVRVDGYKIYYFDHAKGLEELSVDIEAMAKDYFKKASNNLETLLEASVKITDEIPKQIKSGTEKSSAFILANFILMFK